MTDSEKPFPEKVSPVGMSTSEKIPEDIYQTLAAKTEHLMVVRADIYDTLYKAGRLDLARAFDEMFPL
jgi:hypothetical protein